MTAAYSAFQFHVAAWNQHKGHGGHEGKNKYASFVSLVSPVFDRRCDPGTTPNRDAR
jgi:hypothetical protein